MLSQFNTRIADTPKTIGDVLYTDNRDALVYEDGWIGLVHCIAAEDPFALYSLCVQTQRIVYTLALDLLKSRDAAEEATLDVFHEVWREAAGYDSASGSVVAWIMNLTRARALEELQSGSQRRRPAKGSRPSPALSRRLISRIRLESGGALPLPSEEQEREWAWKEVAPGICCVLLSTDSKHQRVSLLVRLAPGMDYPPHCHAGVEELHLLQGELEINDRKLVPGDYHRAEAGSIDVRVRSETGCTCVLITSIRDELR
jgi:DNA-directed RNA polymerase specialized sigma24 family protein